VWSLVKASSSVGPAHFRATRFSVPSPGEAIDRDGEMTPPVNVESAQTHVRRAFSSSRRNPVALAALRGPGAFVTLTPDAPRSAPP
jgi:hypothetical protein